MVIRMKKWIYICLAATLLSTCQKSPVEIVDFDTFHVTNVKYTDVVVNGALNPEIRTMNLGEEDETKVASINLIDVAKHLLETMECNKVIQIAGTYTGHDIDGTPSPCLARCCFQPKAKSRICC